MDKGKEKKKPDGLSRRDFIKGMGTGALGTAVLAPLHGQTIATKKGRVPVYERRTIVLTVNGMRIETAVEANETLLEVLRDRLDLTGAKKVCDRGECGGCTVLLDGEPVYACMFSRSGRTAGRSGRSRAWPRASRSRPSRRPSSRRTATSAASARRASS